MSSAVLRAVPVSNEEVYTEYYPYILKMVGKAGINPQNVEDVAMSLLLRFMERDVLSDYNPEFTTEHGGRIRKAEFATFLSGFVFSYIRYIKGREDLHSLRESTMMDAPVSSTSEATWGEVYGGVHEDTHEDMELEDLILRIQSTLSAVQIKSAKNQCDLPLFFDLVTDQVTEHGKIDTVELAELFGVSKTSIQNWLKRLREQVTVALDL